MTDPFYDPKNHPLSKRAAAPKEPVVSIEYEPVHMRYLVKRDGLVIFVTYDKDQAEMVARERTRKPPERPAMDHAVARAIR